MNYTLIERIKTLKLTCRGDVWGRSPKGVAPSLKGVMLTHLKVERG